MPNNEQPAARKKPPLIRGTAINAESSPSSPAPVVSAATLPPQPEVKSPVLPAYEFLGYLPESYGTKKLFLVARDPHILFAYWDLNQVQYQEAARAAHDGKVFLEVYVPGEGRVQQIHIWDCHKNWYLQVNRPDTNFVAQLGYYRGDGSFEVLARSAEVRTPRDTLSPNTDARFVTIPFHVSFRELYDMIAAQAQPARNWRKRWPACSAAISSCPSRPRIPRDLTEKESDELLEYLGDEEVRRRMVGSFEITEILKKRFETMVSSGHGPPAPGRGSPASAARLAPRSGPASAASTCTSMRSSSSTAARSQREGPHRWSGHHPEQGRHVLVPLRLPGWPVPHPDRRHFRRRRVETRSALLSFLRMTELEGDVRKTAQPVLDEPIGRK